MNSRPKDHHIVPEMHLKHFADAQGKVWTYHKSNGRISAAKPRETGVQRNFYAIEREAGQYEDGLEKWLSIIESDAAPIYEKLLLGEIPQGRDRRTFAWFIGTTLARSPGMVRTFAEMRGLGFRMALTVLATSREKFDEVIDSIENETLAPVDPQSRDCLFELLKDPSRFIINVDRAAGLEVLTIITKRMAQIFYRLGWSLLKPKDESEFFITSDYPVTRMVPKGSHLLLGPAGFIDPNVEVTFPLSRDRLLQMKRGPDGPPSGPRPIRRRMVHVQNVQRAIFAEAQIYADRRDAGIQALVEKCKRQRANLAISGFGVDPQVKVLRKLKP